MANVKESEKNNVNCIWQSENSIMQIVFVENCAFLHGFISENSKCLQCFLFNSGKNYSRWPATMAASSNACWSHRLPQGNSRRIGFRAQRPRNRRTTIVSKYNVPLNRSPHKRHSSLIIILSVSVAVCVFKCVRAADYVRASTCVIVRRWKWSAHADMTDTEWNGELHHTKCGAGCVDRKRVNSIWSHGTLSTYKYNLLGWSN